MGAVTAMPVAGVTLGVLLWGALGSLLFTGVLLLMRTLGMTDAARDRKPSSAA